MFLKSLTVVVSIAFTAAVSAQCTTVGDTTYCYDYDSGNSYSTTDYGTSSVTSGYNSNTGTVWGSNTFRSGNTSQTLGSSSKGAYWNSSTYDLGDTSQTLGSSSNGNTWNSFTDSSGNTTYDSYNAETGKVKTVICDSLGNCY